MVGRAVMTGQHGKVIASASRPRCVCVPGGRGRWTNQRFIATHPVVGGMRRGEVCGGGSGSESDRCGVSEVCGVE